MPAVYWSWNTLLERGWTTRLYSVLLREPDRTPRAKGRIPGLKGMWGIRKDRVMQAEATDYFKDAQREIRAGERKKRNTVRREIDRRIDGWEYVVIVRRMPQNPRDTLNAILGPGEWRPVVKHLWTTRKDVHCYLIRSAGKMAALRLTEVNESIVTYGKVDEMRAKAMKAYE
jgi:hypothetical protein